jgi:hypothetical protein
MSLALLLLSCRCAPAEPDGAGADAPGHYGVALELVAALRAGDIDQVQALARRMDGGESVEAPALAEHAERMHGAVGFAQVAEDLEEAAWAVAVMGRACGECHAAAGDPLGLMSPGDPALPLPPEAAAAAIAAAITAASAAAPAPAGHAAAVDAVWTGAVGPSASLLVEGLAAYAAALPGQAPAAAAVLTAPDPASRADALGALLAGCAGCHAGAGAQ